MYFNKISVPLHLNFWNLTFGEYCQCSQGNSPEGSEIILVKSLVTNSSISCNKLVTTFKGSIKWQKVVLMLTICFLSNETIKQSRGFLCSFIKYIVGCPVKLTCSTPSEVIYWASENWLWEETGWWIVSESTERHWIILPPTVQGATSMISMYCKIFRHFVLGNFPWEFWEILRLSI